MWCCDNVGGLGEHVTCHIPFFLTLFLGLHFATTDGRILTICTSYDVFPCKDVPFGGGDNISPHLGVKCPQNPNFGAVNKSFQAKCVKYWNFRVVETTEPIPTTFCTVIKTAKYSSWVVQISDQQIQYGARPPSWKIEKSPYLSNGLTDLDEIWHGCAECISGANGPLTFWIFKISRWWRTSCCKNR